MDNVFSIVGYGEKGARNNFLDMLGNVRRKLCKDPRDRIYAVRGMTDLSVLPTLGPDYTITPAQLYGEVISRILDGTISADGSTHPSACLAIAPLSRETSDQRGSPQWPSWVPDLHNLTAKCASTLQH